MYMVGLALLVLTLERHQVGTLFAAERRMLLYLKIDGYLKLELRNDRNYSCSATCE